MGLDVVDGIYWSMITMTTIGYGDISGSGSLERAVLCLYLPTAVAALADALAAVGNIGTEKDLVFTDFTKTADQLLLGEAGGPSPDPDETLTEAEFLISVLKDKGIVDELVVRAIRLQFKHIVRHDTWTEDGDTKVRGRSLLSQRLPTMASVASAMRPPLGRCSTIDASSLSSSRRTGLGRARQAPLARPPKATRSIMWTPMRSTAGSKSGARSTGYPVSLTAGGARVWVEGRSGWTRRGTGSRTRRSSTARLTLKTRSWRGRRQTVIPGLRREGQQAVPRL